MSSAAIECVTCEELYDGTAETAKQDGWRFSSILPGGEPGWQCADCAACDVDQVDGFPSPRFG